MRDAVICEPLRTAVGRFGGQFRGLTAQHLGTAVVKALLARTGFPAALIEDVLFAQCYPTMDAPALGRVVALDAGLPVETGGLQIDRRCGSGLQAIIYASMQVATGAADAVIAGGAESMSNAPFYSTAARWGITGNALTLHDALARGRVTAGGGHYPVPGGMLETAENLRRDYAIPREEQDAFACESHRRAVAAQNDGIFGQEIMLREDPQATVTAGNASGQNDGGSACLVTTAELAAEYGLKPLARLKSWAVAGVPPKTMGFGPVPATAKALNRASLRLAELDLLEVNEAFAAQVLACTRAWDFAPADFARLNVHGSGISLGHPVGATGGRILATLLREMDRRAVRYGLETMCIGGGQGLAAIFERF